MNVFLTLAIQWMNLEDIENKGKTSLKRSQKASRGSSHSVPLMLTIIIVNYRPQQKRFTLQLLQEIHHLSNSGNENLHFPERFLPFSNGLLLDNNSQLPLFLSP